MAPSNASDLPAHGSWLRTARRRLFIDTQFPDWTRPGQSGGAIDELRNVATRLDPEAIVTAASEAGAEVIVAFAKCQYGNFYYDTAFGHQHSGLHGRDHFGELLERAHSVGLRVVAYYSNRWDVEAARANPDWVAVDPDGGRSYERWPTLCLLSPYRELVVEQLTELGGRYDIDGLWSDIIHGPPCYCERCERSFGATLPSDPGDPRWLDLLRWHRSVISGYVDVTREALRAARPRAAFVVNHFGSVYVDARLGLSLEHLRASDGTSTEGYAEWHGLLYPAFASEYLAAAAPDRPSEVLISRFANTWDFSLKPVAQMRFEAFSAAARGSAVCFDDEPYLDGTLEPMVYERISEVFGEMQRREPWLDLDRYEIEAAVYVSQASRELATVLDGSRAWGHLQFPSAELNDGPSDLVPAVMGTYKALVEAQMAVGVATDPVPPFGPGAPRVLCLPGVLALDDAEVERIERFVAAGGGLVATGATSMFETDGTRRASLRLRELFGADVVDPAREPASYTYVEAPSAGARPFPQYLPTLDIKTISSETEVMMGRRRPVIQTSGELYFHNNQPPPSDQLAEPAVVRRTYGRGRVVYMPGSPDGNVARFGSEDHARLLVDAVRWAAGVEPHIRVDGPTGMRVVQGWKGDELVVHLVTAAPDLTVRHGPDRTLETITRVSRSSDVRLHVSVPVESATLQPHGVRLSVESEGACSVVSLPTASDWETIGLELASH